DPLPRPPRRQRRGDHLTGHAEPGDLPIEVIAGHARLIAGRDRTLSLEALEYATDQLGLVRNLPQLGLYRTGVKDSHDELPLAVIECDECSTLTHDRPPFACGSVPSPEQPTLMCDRSGRSFHMV